MRYRLRTIFTIIFIATISTVSYVRDGLRICDGCDYVATPLMDMIASGEAAAPFAYRILTPYALAALGGSIGLVLAFHLLTRIIIFGLLYQWAKRWRAHGLFTVAIFAIVMESTYPTWAHSDYALTELVFVLAGWLILTTPHIRRWHIVSYAILITIGTLNREATGFILLCSWWAWYPKRWRVSLMLSALALATVLGLRFFIEADPNTYTLARVWIDNTQSWRFQGAIVQYATLLPLFVAIGAVSGKLRVYSKLVIALAPYVVLILTLGVWQETRLLLPIFALILPALTIQE